MSSRRKPNAVLALLKAAKERIIDREVARYVEGTIERDARNRGQQSDNGTRKRRRS